MDYENKKKDSIPQANRKTWWRNRNRYLKEHPACELCGESNKDKLTIHHKTPHNGDPALVLDYDNLQTLCRSCHNQITGNERRCATTLRAVRQYHLAQRMARELI